MSEFICFYFSDNLYIHGIIELKSSQGTQHQKNALMTDTKIQKTMFQYMKLFIDGNACLSYEELGTGNIFSRLLLHAQGFKFVFGQIKENPSNWIHKLANIKVIIKKVNYYFEYKLGKGIRTSDINVIQIAKNNKISEILKLFEIIVATLIESSNKDEHFTKIANLDQDIQANFVWLIQKILQNRIIDLSVFRAQRASQQLLNLEYENALLQKQVDSLIQQNQLLQRQYNQLNNEYKHHQQQIANMIQSTDISKEDKSYKLIVQNQRLKTLEENLKKKLAEKQYHHEHQISKMNEELKILHYKIDKLQQTQQTLELYKEKYNQMHTYAMNNKKWQKQQIKLNRILADKDNYINKIQQKIDQLIQQNYQHEEKQVYLMMEIEKKQVQFKELQKQVRKFASDTSTQIFTLSDQNTSQVSPSIDITQALSQVSDQYFQTKQLRQSYNNLRQKIRQKQRENNILRHKLQKTEILQMEKKKLQKMVVDAHQHRNEQLTLLISLLSQYYENHINKPDQMTQKIENT